MGGLFSKGSSAPPMPQYTMPQQQMPDMSGIFEAMMGMVGAIQASTEAMMQGMMAMQAPQLPDIPEINVPEIEREPEIDWTEKQEMLSQQMKANYNALSADRKGRLETVLTSPLLDEEDAQVSSSVLAGE